MLKPLENIVLLARKRKYSPVKNSYTNKLLADKLLSKAKVIEEIDELIITLESCRKKLIGLKDVSDIYTWLLVSERITRLFEGARITCCKDGKDLSIIGASLEMSVIMGNNHHVNTVER